MTDATVFAVVAAVYAVGHQVGDYWIQTDGQAQRKGLSGWTGRRACLTHVATYTATLAAFLAVAGWLLHLPLRPGAVAVGLAVSAGTHYLADRRTPLQRIADATGKGGFWRRGEALASGAAHLDQSWHLGWLFAAALLTASVPF